MWESGLSLGRKGKDYHSEGPYITADSRKRKTPRRGDRKRVPPTFFFFFF